LKLYYALWYEKKRRVFNRFNIIDTKTVEKFVPKSNEKYFNKDFQIEKLPEGDYLFKQRQFGGKAVDCAIISVKKNGHAEVFLLQISINKAVLYTIGELKNIIEQFIEYFGYQFEFIINREDVYFTYIFHTKEKSELYTECEEKRLKCIFFNPSIQRFTNINNADLDDPNNKISLSDIFINPFNLINNVNNDVIMKDMTSGIVLKDILKPNFYLNGNQKKGIENFWKNLHSQIENNNIEIFFSHTSYSLDENFLTNKTMYLRQLYKKEIDDWIKAIICEEEKKKDISKNNNLLLIYKKINLSFRIISSDGIDYQIKYIPINTKVEIKNYDVYIVKYQ